MEKIELTPSQIDFLRSALSGFSPEMYKVELAGRAGSQRYFVRVAGEGLSRILVVWDSRDEDWSRFIEIQGDLSGQIDFLPAIYNSDEMHGLILEEDLGNMTLKRFSHENSSRRQEVASAYREVLRSLYKWQKMDVSGSPAIKSRKMDLETFLWESSYFARFCVTDFCACERFLDDAWERERRALAEEASRLPGCCIHRDFQSENVMIFESRIRFVDYQGARLGPPQYDTASLLFDPYVSFLDELADELYSYYSGLTGDTDDKRAFYICAAQRLMQALGAYGNLSLHRGKEWYREFIPVALERLCGVLGTLPEFPRLRRLAETCSESLHR
ncbi:MAG: phosphotransferase [Fibrobacter sp.]|nr:phosphotransferase [Fibrobacter sp.]